MISSFKFQSVLRSSHISAILFLVLITLVILLIYFSHIFPLREKPEKKITLGAWTEGLFDPETKTLDPEKLLEFENLIKKKVTIAHYYLGWEYLDREELVSQFKILDSYGWTPMLNTNPYFFDQCPVSQKPLYKAISNGECDEFLKKAGKNLAKVEKPFYLLFAWEMNNKQHEWSVPYTGSSNEDFIKAWRHIYTIFQKEGAKNIMWVFCPNIPDDPIVPYVEIYPGDEYVDFLGLDGYNWGTTKEWSSWVSFEDVFSSSYNKVVQIAPTKPIIIAEVNTTDQGGDKAKWYQEMFEVLPRKFPQVSALIIFNEDRSENENVNWKVDINEDSLKAFREGIKSPVYE